MPSSQVKEKILGHGHTKGKTMEATVLFVKETEKVCTPLHNFFQIRKKALLTQ